MATRFAQHAIARAGGNEIVNQVVINDDCIEQSDLSDAYQVYIPRESHCLPKSA